MPLELLLVVFLLQALVATAHLGDQVSVGGEGVRNALFSRHFSRLFELIK